MTLHGQQVSWTEYLARAPLADLVSTTGEAEVKQLLLDPVEPGAFKQLTSAVLACWHSHTAMWKKMLDRGETSGLYLEDDVDIEWDIGRLWPNARRVLPMDWEIVFLGHCWGRTRTSRVSAFPLPLSADGRFCRTDVTEPDCAESSRTSMSSCVRPFASGRRAST